MLQQCLKLLHTYFRELLRWRRVRLLVESTASKFSIMLATRAVGDSDYLDGYSFACQSCIDRRHIKECNTYSGLL